MIGACARPVRRARVGQRHGLERFARSGSQRISGMVDSIQKMAVMIIARRTDKVPGISSTMGKMISSAMTPPAEPTAQPVPDTLPISSGDANSGKKPS